MAATAPPGADALVGAVLSRRFKLIALLGQGGMGLVYEAQSITPPSGRVAIKILRAEYLADTQVRERFLAEGQACMRLVHPNVLKVFEVGQAEDGTPYLVMERLDGHTLNALSSPGRPLAPARAIAITQAVLAGLGAAHAQGVVHRDLKPENIFVLDGDAGVKILDFGIAKVMDVAGGQGSRTRTGMLLGTPAFMSPEQARSARDADLRSDLWSVAVMLYEILTGKQAFEAPTEFARLTQILTAEVAPPSSASQALAQFDAFFARALQKDREHRFQSAMEMSQALGAIAVPTVSVPASGPGHSAYVPTLSSSSDAVPADHTTLGSHAAPNEQRSVSHRPPPIIVLPGTATDPISFAGGAQPRGVSQIVVVLLVTAALLAGFVLGFAVAKSM